MPVPFCRVLPIALGLAGAALMAGAVGATDMPHHRPTRRHAPQRLEGRAPPILPTPVLVPRVPEIPAVVAAPPPGLVVMPTLPDPDPAPRRGGCLPGYMIGAEGACRRSGELIVACDPFGGPCSPVPPTPIPYGIGPYLRPDY